MLLIGVVLVCESATLSGAVKEVEQHCENQCQQKSLRLRQVTTDNNCKDKCFAKMMIMIQVANHDDDWKETTCEFTCRKGRVPPSRMRDCIASCRRYLPGTLTPQEANWDWGDLACGKCYLLPTSQLVKRCFAKCRG